MSKSVWKIPFISKKLITKSMLSRDKIITWERNVVICAPFLNKKFAVHNGTWMTTFNIKTNMIGHKLGEFVLTKRLGSEMHTRTKKKKKR